MRARPDRPGHFPSTVHPAHSQFIKKVLAHVREIRNNYSEDHLINIHYLTRECQDKSLNLIILIILFILSLISLSVFRTVRRGVRQYISSAHSPRRATSEGTPTRATPTKIEQRAEKLSNLIEGTPEEHDFRYTYEEVAKSTCMLIPDRCPIKRNELRQGFATRGEVVTAALSISLSNAREV